MPSDRTHWGPFLLAVMGGGDVRQIDGMGGADQLTSKCCIVGKSHSGDADVDYTFAQVGVEREEVWWDINCGNLTSAVGVFAVEQGMVAAQRPIAQVRVFQTNTQKFLRVEVPVTEAGVNIEGNTRIDGVQGTGAAVRVDFFGTAGATLGRGLTPTGNRRDTLQVPGVGAVEVSIVDLANMCVFFRASDIGEVGVEMPRDSDRLRATFHVIRTAAQELLGSPASSSTPWPIMVGPARDYSALPGTPTSAETMDFTARVLAAETMHKAYPGTGGCCTAVAALLEGTVVNDLYRLSGRGSGADRSSVVVGHPSGVMRFATSVLDAPDREPVVERVTFDRTARRIMRGDVFVRQARFEELLTTFDARDPTMSGVPAAKEYPASGQDLLPSEQPARRPT